MKEIDILDADATTIAIKKLILEAKEQVLLVCPYLDLSASIITSIQKAIERGVSVNVVYRVDKSTENAKNEEKEKELKQMGCNVARCKRLHTKCYMNEQYVIISSLNLLTSSQSGNFELSARFDIATHPQAYAKVMQHIDDIYRISGVKGTIAKVAPKKAAPAKPTATKRATRSRVGKKWTAADDKKLIQMFHEKIDYAQIATSLGRTETAVKSRLAVKGFIEYDKELGAYKIVY